MKDMLEVLKQEKHKKYLQLWRSLKKYLYKFS